MSKCTVIGAVVMVLVLGCSDSELPTEVPIDAVISLGRLDTNVLRADGATTTRFRAKIPGEATTRAIAFKASSGSFHGGDATVTIQADPEGFAVATYVTPTTAGSVTVTATVGTTYSAAFDVIIQPAYGETIVGEVSSATASQDGTTKPTITVFLSRTIGKVSLGIPVTFAATQIVDGKEKNVGRFSGLDLSKTDGNGKASAVFAADTGDVTKDGLVTIRASTVTDSGTPLVFQTTISIK